MIQNEKTLHFEKLKLIKKYRISLTFNKYLKSGPPVSCSPLPKLAKNLKGGTKVKVNPHLNFEKFVR
jgi:hypothetical protein